jgi:hypothetical protein
VYKNLRLQHENALLPKKEQERIKTDGDVIETQRNATFAVVGEENNEINPAEKST